MSKQAQTTELMQAIDLPTGAVNTVPEWIQLLPSGAEIQTVDERGPYRITDPQAVAAASTGRNLPIDENHAIDIKGPRGEPTPAVGRIVEVQVRDDGSLWGRVEWNSAGHELMAERAYVGVSPVITHDGDKIITGILRASLTNKPNLRGMAALNMENDMDLSAIAKAAGLAADATEAAIIAALTAMKPATEVTALQTQISQIGVALGVAGDASAEVITAAAMAAGQSDGKQTIVALQAELTDLGKKFNELATNGARVRAEAFVDGEIRKGRVGVKPLRDHYIAMHMEDADRVEKEISALPIVGGTTPTVSVQTDKDGEVALQSAHVEAARLLGMDPKKYAAALKADREEAL